MPLYITILYGLSFAIMLTIGILVFVKDHRSGMNISFFLFSLSMLAWMVFLYFSALFIPGDLPNALLFIRLTFAASVFIPFSLSLFFYHFPRKIFEIPRWVMVFFSLFTVALAFISAFTPLIEESIYMEGIFPIDVFGPLYAVYLIHVLFHLGFSIFCAVRKLFVSKDIEKKKIHYVSLGFFTFIFLAAMTNVILPIFGIFILQREAVAFSLILFFAVLHAIYQYRFFNFTFLTLSFLRYLIIFIIFLTAAGSIILPLRAFFPGMGLAVIHFAGITAGFLVLMVAEKYFPNLYSSSFRRFRKAIAEFSLNIFDCKTFKELQDFVALTFEEKLNVKNARIIVLESSDLRDGIPMYKPDSFTKELARVKDVLVAEELAVNENPTSQDKFLLQKMKDFNAELCFPLRSERKLIGFFLLGRKRLKKSFSREEIEEIRKTIPGLEVTVMNILITNSLREENDIMKRIIHERTGTLKRNNEKLEKMIEQQNNFISMTAHEFRTPLTVAMLGLEQIQYLHKGKVSSEVEEDILTSHEQLNKLTLLINRLLEMRRVEDDKIPVVMENVNIAEFVRETAKGMQLIANSEEMTVTYKGPREKSVMVKTDRVKLQEILDNLLQNAIKFSEKGGKIEVALSIPKKEKKAVIMVKDYGKGIPKKDQMIIFEKFHQGSRYSQGVGIGLYLCKQYLDLLKGSIRVSSTPGRGATFTVGLPLEN